MSTGGIFKLIVNDGIQDSLLLASDYLTQRLKHIRAVAKQKSMIQRAGFSREAEEDNSWGPTVDMINKTHVIFTNGSYKPFVATGFEYRKVSTTAKFGGTSKFTLEVFGDFINDCVVHLKLSGLSAKSPKDRVRYASYLGHKLISSTSITVNGNSLDNTTSDDYNAFYEFQVPSDKKNGWLRNIGQEIPHSAYVSADPTYDLHREYKLFGDGNQTYKQSHDEIELWIPLLFWFRKVSCSLQGGAIPYGQSDINIKFAEVAEVVGFIDFGGGGDYNSPKITSCDLYMNHIFMNPDVSDIFRKKFGFTLIRVHGRHLEKIIESEGEIKIHGLKWPTESLYVSFKPDINMTLPQYWHSSSTLEYNEVRVPVVAKNPFAETICSVDITTPPTTNTVTIGYISGVLLSVVPSAYISYDFIITGGYGYSNLDPSLNRYRVGGYTGVPKTITIVGEWRIIPDSTTTFELFRKQVGSNLAKYYRETPTVSSIGIHANGIPIYDTLPESFYNSYLPYRYGEAINTPGDRGWYMINFNFFPGDHQPSGHINLSRAREFYIKYTSVNGNISRTKSVMLIVLSFAINFLLVSDGGAVLRYST
jgi:hypothetical protein